MLFEHNFCNYVVEIKNIKNRYSNLFTIYWWLNWKCSKNTWINNWQKKLILFLKFSAGIFIFFVLEKWDFPFICGLQKFKFHHQKKLLFNLLDRVIDAKIFTNLYFRLAYNFFLYNKNDEWKTVFRYWFGYFELISAPITFQNFEKILWYFYNYIFRWYFD